ncbi:endonuclease/exonuclease/phosphatase family protein [Corallococcus sp. CA054B]|uniref:endonuclease/exonuclease/phosphatase family protein n=1 Tax=Corallococcus sp. CA054B TaxID=2316734 RepID=UPI0013151CD9|nr:endonuclease/exonuclease/phosphatase family protein [Corallococcus sp. CA054B]
MECNPIVITPSLRSEGLGSGNEVSAIPQGASALRSFVYPRDFNFIASVDAGPAISTLRLSGSVDVKCELGGVEYSFQTPFLQDLAGNGSTAGLTLTRSFSTNSALCPAGYRRVAVRYQAVATAFPSTGPGVSTLTGTAEYLRWLKFMTWNIHHGVGRDQVLNLQRISDTLLASGAHFAGFQDVDRYWSGRSDCKNQPMLLQQQTGWAMRYSASLDQSGNIFQCGLGNRRQYGNLILSRFPIQSDAIWYLYYPDGYERRSAIGAVVSIGGTSITIFSSHLQHGSGSSLETIRYFQAMDLMEFINLYSGPRVLMADLNAIETAWELQPVRDGLQDTWFAAGNPSADRIDYIFSTPLPVARSYKVASDASDHDALMSWVTLEPASAP